MVASSDSIREGGESLKINLDVKKFLKLTFTKARKLSSMEIRTLTGFNLFVKSQCMSETDEAIDIFIIIFDSEGFDNSAIRLIFKIFIAAVEATIIGDSFFVNSQFAMEKFNSVITKRALPP